MCPWRVRHAAIDSVASVSHIFGCRLSAFRACGFAFAFRPTSKSVSHPESQRLPCAAASAHSLRSAQLADFDNLYTDSQTLAPLLVPLHCSRHKEGRQPRQEQAKHAEEAVLSEQYRFVDAWATSRAPRSRSHNRFAGEICVHIWSRASCCPA